MKSEIEWKEAKEKFFSPQNWVAEKINGRTIKSTLLAQGSDGWKENKNKVAPESSCILEFEDGSEIEFRGRNLNQWMGINFSSPIVKGHAPAPESGKTMQDPAPNPPHESDT